jgi:alkanesulfonate monooxygenase SsuD/methylene tetrahydromethanopterin reductase-like flavin-dependent oxidoreductase (luciferase family)
VVFTAAARIARLAAMKRRIGLHLTSFTFRGVEPARRIEHALAIVRAADQSGFDSLWLNDHLVETMGPERGSPRPETYVFLTAAASVSSRLTLGALASSIYFRSPALLARIAVTLHAVAGGRTVLGVGAGHPMTEAEHRAFGLDFPPIKERMDRLEAVVPQLREMTGGGIPILVAGSGEHRLLRIVARHAGLCNLSSPAGDSLDVVRHKLDVLRAHCAAVGRDYAEIRKTYKGMLFLGQDPAADPATGTFTAANAREGAAGFFKAGIDEVVVQVASLAEPNHVEAAAAALLE